MSRWIPFESTNVVVGDLDLDLDDRWSKLLPELLMEIVKRVEESEDQWPLRRSVVACACVCRRWREVVLGIVRSPLYCGRITFPLSLKQAGPREFPMQCLIKRDRRNSIFYLYLCLTQTFTDKGKFLLAAKRAWHGGRVEYIISLDAHDFSQRSNAYVGKLRADFLGAKFTIYDSHPPFYGAKASSCRGSRRFASKQISPQVSAGNFEVGKVSYRLNLVRSRGPRKMSCSLQCLSEGEEDSKSKGSSVVLKNKAPRWHDLFKCWSLNFHGRVTVASVQNFQLVAKVGDEETVLLQFGKVGDDLFTMEYRQPLSAFQAFGICLTSFGSKFACD